MSKLHHPKNKYERRKIATKKSLNRFKDGSPSLGATDAHRREIPAEAVSQEEAEARDNLDPRVVAELREHASYVERA